MCHRHPAVATAGDLSCTSPLWTAASRASGTGTNLGGFHGQCAWGGSLSPGQCVCATTTVFPEGELLQQPLWHQQCCYRVPLETLFTPYFQHYHVRKVSIIQSS